MGEEGLQELAAANEELKRWQEAPNTPEDLAKVPTLQVQGWYRLGMPVGSLIHVSRLGLGSNTSLILPSMSD